jgi:hypothetical protein
LVHGILIYKEMELTEILQRIKNGFEYIDENTQIQNSNRRNREILYNQGFKSLFENQVTNEVKNWWLDKHHEDFKENQKIESEYLDDSLNIRYDLVFSSTSYSGIKYEWGIELKYIQLVGDNGKNNDHTIQKVLSPYLKDRSLFHDIEKLNRCNLFEKKAVIAFGFEYDFEILRILNNRHPNEIIKLNNLEHVLENNDPINGNYKLKPIIDLVENNLKIKNPTSKNAEQIDFTAFRHPCGGYGKIFGWQL